jgi:hypothetical protein
VDQGILPAPRLVAIEANWDLDTCEGETIAYVDMEAARAEDKSKIEPQGKLKDGDWVQWELKLVNFLQNVLGVSGVPLHCVICKDLSIGHQFANPAEALIDECPLEGLVHREDNW